MNRANASLRSEVFGLSGTGVRLAWNAQLTAVTVEQRGDLGGEMTDDLREFRGGNMDIDLIPKSGLTWKRDACPWNEAENSTAHKCAIKDTSVCRYFKGIKPVDTVLCTYPHT